MIDPTTQLATMIRAQFRAQFQTQAKALGTVERETPQESRSARQAHGEPDTQGPDSTDAQIKQMVALRVRALSPDDPQRQRKAFRLFLESILMQTFGRERIDGLAFDQMVDAVMQKMEADVELHAAMREAGGLLLADATPGTPTSPPAR
ncbi:hypothetical protein [Acidovorax cavernicola]|uniref:Uncharacterized protein n=1 Tax=Acidovorax cavernicola TaxID=1675792 RepID=A0A9X8D490_9BURK|nr:hypothetical protein [Acidovorax cavernicola]RIX79082.1 hypothetical protein D3H34_15175 [Acidovorax cavernicola]